MTIEADIIAALTSSAPLLALVPATRIAIDAVAQDTQRPYIVVSKTSEEEDRGLDNTLFGTDYSIDVQIIGTTRKQALAIKPLVRAALVDADFIPDQGSGGYDPENDLEVETVGLQHYVGESI